MHIIKNYRVQLVLHRHTDKKMVNKDDAFQSSKAKTTDLELFSQL